MPDPLPPCKHRGPAIGAHVVCGSNRLTHTGLVTLSTCTICPYANQDNVVRRIQPPKPASLPANQTPNTKHQTQKTPAEVPCKFRGQPSQVITCDLCGQRGQPLQLYTCSEFGECSIHRQHSKTAACLPCARRSTDWDRQTDIAPLRKRGEKPWQGCAVKKPWQYDVTAMIAVYCPGPQLDQVVELLRLQTVKPYIMLVDTGTPPPELQALEARYQFAADVEIHHIRGHGYQDSSEVVAAAIDVALALCQTRWLYLTHDDVFARRQDLIEWQQWLSERYDTPVVGWEMSDRTISCGSAWRGMVSHTSTLLDLPQLRGCSWSLRTAYEEFGLPKTHASWPDTETAFNLQLQAKGIRPLLLGPEINYERQTNRHWVHCRSYTGAGLYSDPHRQRAEGWIQEETTAAIKRIQEWKSSDAHPDHQLVRGPECP